MSEPLISIRNVKKYFPIRGGLFQGTVSHVHAVDGVSFDIGRGETLGLVGESGCGKSTLSRCIMRLVEPTSGEITYGGTDVSKIPRDEYWRRTQMVFQDPRSSLNPRLSIGYSVGESLIVRGAGAEEVRSRVTELLGIVGMNPEHFSRYPHEFSGGQRQRLLISKALITDPEFIVLDEPTSSLDVSVQAKILNLLNRLKEERNLTFLFVSHDLSVIKHMCDRIVVMYVGRVVEMAPKDEIFGNTLHPYTRLLIDSIPKPGAKVEPTMMGRESIEFPSNIDLPEGCRFSPRCAHAGEECSKEQPELVEVEPVHFVACHMYRK